MALFGTDGIRGLANGETLTAEIAVDVAVAAAHILVESSANKRPVAIVGQDSRASGEFLEAAVAAGLASAGVDVLRVGVLPTPAIALLSCRIRCRSRRHDFGISQSNAR
jgi:phosphoglucosamine mutase